MVIVPGILQSDPSTNRRGPNHDPLCLPLGMLVDELGVGLQHESPAVSVPEPIGQRVDIDLVVQAAGCEEMAEAVAMPAAHYK